MMIQTHKRFRHSVFFRLKKKDRQQQKEKEAEKRTDEKEATKLNQRNLNKEYVIKNDVIQMTSKRNYVKGEA